MKRRLLLVGAAILAASQLVYSQGGFDARVRLIWNFEAAGKGAIYLNVTDQPYNLNQYGIPIKINICNELVSKNQASVGSKMLNLPEGRTYYAALVCDNIPGKPGRWVAGKEFRAQDKMTVTFEKSDLVFASAEP